MTPAAPRRVRVIGPGRAGGALMTALGEAGWEVAAPRSRGDELTAATDGIDVLVVATPDAAIAEVAAAVRPAEEVVVMHLSGSLGLDVLAPHRRRASLHPLVALPSPAVGASRLRGAWFAVAGDAVAGEMAGALGGRAVHVGDDDRARYHAAACIASNHLVALLGQVERLAEGIGVPLEAFWDLVRGTVDNVVEMGPAAALTGPAARGDEATLARHRAALPPDERPAYDAMVELARRLATGPHAP